MRHLIGLLVIGLLAASAYAAPPTEPVADLQAFLNDRGCDVGTADGQWGKATTRGAEQFAARSGIAIERPVSAELLLSLHASDAKCGPVDILGRFVPAEILARVAEARSVGWQCPVNTIDLNEVLEAKSVKSITGMQSNYNNQHDLPGYDTLLRFVPSVAGLEARAYITADDELKTALVNKLAEWAGAGALTKTRDCSPSSGNNCGQPWQTPNGNDPAPSYDFLAVQYQMMPLALGYYAYLQDFEPKVLARQHQAIAAWLDVFNGRLYGDAEVLLGGTMNDNLPTLFNEMRAGNAVAVRARLEKIAAGLDSLILDDGSLKDKTTRGSRAMKYHFGGLDSLMIALEVLKANGMDLYPQFEYRLHRSAKIFLDAYDDQSTIYPWAKVNLESPGDPAKQDFSFEKDIQYAGNTSWFYIYSHRYPDDPQTARIVSLLKSTNTLHDQDSVSGLGLQCLYMASLPQLIGPGLDEDLAEQKRLADAPEFSFTGAMATEERDGDHFIRYTFSFIGAQVKGSPVSLRPLRVDADFYGGTSAKLETANELSLNMTRRQFSEAASRSADYLSCGEGAARFDEYSQDQQIYLHFSSDPGINKCVLEIMSEADRKLVLSFMNATREMGLAAGDPGADLVTIYDVVANRPFR